MFPPFFLKFGNALQILHLLYGQKLLILITNIFPNHVMYPHCKVNLSRIILKMSNSTFLDAKFNRNPNPASCRFICQNFEFLRQQPICRFTIIRSPGRIPTFSAG